MKKYTGVVVVFVLIGLFIANIVYIRIALREVRCERAQTYSAHNWQEILGGIPN